jgi:hypothetical protein
LVFVGAAELENFPPVKIGPATSEGVYVYKLGTFAEGTCCRIREKIFIIFFDRSGKVIFRRGNDVSPGGKVADIDSDTRSERRIASSQ